MNPIKEDILNEVLNIVSSVTGVSVADIKSKVRKQALVSARQMFCAYMVDYSPAKYTLSEIGDAVCVDHSTVLHSKKIALNYCATEHAFRKNYEAICDQASTSPIIESLAKHLKENYLFLNPDEIRSAIEVAESKIKVLEDWLSRHHENSYRAKVLMDVRDCNRELTAKKMQLADFEQETQLSKS